MNSNVPIIILVLVVLFSLLFIGIGIGIRISLNKKKLRCTERVQGTVTQMRREVGSMGTDGVATISWYPTYCFTINEEKIELSSLFGQSKQRFYVGQKVTIYYNPENYTDIYVPEEHINIIGTLFIGVGAAILTATLLVAILFISLGLI